MLDDRIKQEVKLQLSLLGPISYLQDQIIIVKVGDDDNPASQENLEDVQSNMNELLKGTKLRVLVTHHAIEFETQPIGDYRVVVLGVKPTKSVKKQRQAIEDALNELSAQPNADQIAKPSI